MVDPRPNEPPPVDVNKVHTYIADATFPADRDSLIRHADAKDAPEDVVRALGTLRRGHYMGEAGVYQDLLKSGKTPYR